MIIFFSSTWLIYFWLILAIVFLFIEITTPGLFFFIAFSVGCCFSAILAYLQTTFMIQCILGLVVTLISFFILRHFFSAKVSGENIETNVDALVGQKGVVIKTIEPNLVGQVKVGGEIWPAQSLDNLILQKGTVVRVVSVKGNRLVVKNLEVKHDDRSC